MSEYELYTRILAPWLKPDNQDVLIEKTGGTDHKAEVIADKKTIHTLYRYDQKEQREKFFPFFNNTHDGESGEAEIPAPQDLLKFCDYILLAERNNVLYVLLLELKSGDNGDAYKQLDASEVFMEFVKNTAKRISESNEYMNFDARNIKVRKIVLKPALKLKPTTNLAKNRSPQVNVNNSPIYYPSNLLPLHLFCIPG
ncbi:MAG: hypothetical protein K5883_10305 [Pseudobutyrivibrio sp.]|nr:hypothetical protein [Pseudobutyrivibrio sp.]